MNNRPKFKIWDKERNEWYRPVYNADNGELYELLVSISGDLIMRTVTGFAHESTFSDRFEIVQFTGLHDKNGKEIYEGDVVGRFHEAVKPIKELKEIYDEQMGYLHSNNMDNLSLLVNPALVNGREAYWEKILVEIPNFYCTDYENVMDDWEILGNIYQHPGLLEKQTCIHPITI